MKTLPNNPSESTKKRNPHLWAVERDEEGKAQRMVLCPPKRIRQSSKPLMNGLEQSFWNEVLNSVRPGAKAQAIRFRLANGIAYKPDFVDLSTQPLMAWECKGPHAFRGGLENLKMAANLYPEIYWVLVWKKDGQWQQQRVLP